MITLCLLLSQNEKDYNKMYDKKKEMQGSAGSDFLPQNIMLSSVKTSVFGQIIKL